MVGNKIRWNLAVFRHRTAVTITSVSGSFPSALHLHTYIVCVNLEKVTAELTAMHNKRYSRYEFLEPRILAADLPRYAKQFLCCRTLKKRSS